MTLKPRWWWLGTTGIILLLAGFAIYYREVTNAGVVEQLLTNPQGQRAQIVMLLNLPSGRQLPVNYLREGHQVFVGADGPWWREFEPDAQTIELWIQGKQYRGRAKTVLDDPAYTKDVFSRLRPTVPEWLPDWLNGKLIVINLEI